MHLYILLRSIIFILNLFINILLQTSTKLYLIWAISYIDSHAFSVYIQIQFVNKN